MESKNKRIHLDMQRIHAKDMCKHAKDACKQARLHAHISIMQVKINRCCQSCRKTPVCII